MLRFVDSFDHYLAADAPFKWTSTLNIFRETGLHGYGMRGHLTKGIAFGSNVLIMECYIKNLLANGTHFGTFDTNDTPQLDLSSTLTGALKVGIFDNTGTPFHISAPDLVRQNIWYHLAWRVFFHLTAGSVEVRLNGAPVISLTGIPTTAFYGDARFFSGAMGAFSIGAASNDVIFDDLVVMDDVDDGIDDPRLPGGGGFDKFIGPVEVLVKRPNAPGLAAEWTPTPTLTPNWDTVNDAEPDGDASRTDATPAQVGASDLFGMEDLAADEDVVAVQTLVLARKTEEGVAAIAPLTRDSGVTTLGPAVHQPSTYSYMHGIQDRLPDGTLWTKARWDAIQKGYRRIV